MNLMSRFFVLDIGNRTQYKFAWCEPFYRNPKEFQHSDDCPTCPVCKDAIGMCRWLPPHRVVIKQPRRVGDFLDGVFSFVVSERFKTAYDTAGLSGIETFFPLEIVQMGSGRTAKRYAKPTLFGAEVVHASARIDYKRSATKWWEQPHPDYCRHCGPGGGGKGGTAERFEGLYFEGDTWEGEDFFYPINLCGTVLVSEGGATFIRDHQFSNVSLIPSEEYFYDLFDLSFLRAPA
jgi:hypothetical protein